MLLKKINIIIKYLYYYPLYYYCYKKLKIKKNSVLLESTHGRGISGHLFYVMKELCDDFPQLGIYVAVRDVKETEAFLLKKHLTKVHVVKHLSKDYYKLLTRAEYLLNDTTFYSFFMKKEGQRYINIWHGTPLKKLGKDTGSITDMANVQRNFYMADAIITSNEYTQNIIADAYNLNNVYQGKMVLAPSPRNSVLLDKEVRDVVRGKLGISNKKAFFYMPTWRGTAVKVENNDEKIFSDLTIISKSLGEDERFFVKLHPFQKGIDLSGFSNIYPFPAEYELYEFLTAMDVLITDYSSIMYDFLLTDRKIILYTYDKEEYFSTRGVYDNIDSYPFEQTGTIEALVQEMRKHATTDYTDMKKRFCPYDDVNGAKIVSQYIFQDKKHEKIIETSLYNGKETVAILGGDFWDNGVTTALLNTFANIDTSKRNYIVIFGQGRLKKEHEFRVKNLPKDVVYYPIPEIVNAGLFDYAIYAGYMKLSWFRSSWINKKVEEISKNDYHRIIGDLKIDHFVHYTGFGSKYSEMIRHVPNNINTVMFCHTNVMEEHKAKKNFNIRIIFSAYESVSKVALVHSNLEVDLLRELPAIKDKLYVVNNFLGEERIRKLSEDSLYDTLSPTMIEYAFSKELTEEEVSCLDAKSINTKSLGVQKARLFSDLLNDNITTFINIGRYDYQKGHERLISAFERVYLKNPNTRLIIVAPHGPLREQTISLVEQSSAREGIFILGRMSNPYPLLKFCDAFVLSSHYEGLGLVVYETLAVGTTVITVNLKETTQYLQNNEAIIVENSEEGIYQGMLQYLTTGGQRNEFDFSIPKQKSLKEFEELFN